MALPIENFNDSEPSNIRTLPVEYQDYSQTRKSIQERPVENEKIQFRFYSDQEIPYEATRLGQTGVIILNEFNPNGFTGGFAAERVHVDKLGVYHPKGSTRDLLGRWEVAGFYMPSKERTALFEDFHKGISLARTGYVNNPQSNPGSVGFVCDDAFFSEFTQFNSSLPTTARLNLGVVTPDIRLDHTEDSYGKTGLIFGVWFSEEG